VPPSSEDLRERLLAEAARLVDESGVGALTLRALAARAGVSRQAPYLCFANKEALEAALAAEGLRREAQWVHDESAGDPKARLYALARAHLRLRAEHPGLYVLAHGAVPKAASAELQTLAAERFASLREAIAAACPGEPDIQVIRQRCMIAWAMVRGFGELAGMRSSPASVPGGPEQWALAGLDALLEAWTR